MKHDYNNSDIEKIIDEKVHNAKHREILKDRYIDGLLFKELEKKHNYSIQWIKTLVYKYEKKIF